MDTDDLVMMVSDDRGTPRRFCWRDRTWAVAGHPIPWTRRPPWWGQATASGQVVSLVQRMWRVVGLDISSGETVTVDLAVEEAGWCRVSTVEG